MTRRRDLGIGLVFLLFFLASDGVVRGEESCTELGQPGTEMSAVRLCEILREPTGFHDAFVTTEGVVYVYGRYRYLCVDADEDLRDCIGLSFDSRALGASESLLAKLMGQWYGLRVRLSGRFIARSPERTGFRGDLREVSGVRLLDPVPEGLLCLDNVDEMPPPETPHDFVAGRRWKEVRCGPKDRDAGGRLVCLDGEEPWVWIETAEGFERFTHDRKEQAQGWVNIVALGEGRFVAVFVPMSRSTEFLTDRHIESGQMPALAELAVWTGSYFVDVSARVLEVAVNMDDRPVRRVVFAELSASEEGAGSEILAVDGHGQVQQLWASRSAEVTEILDMGDELLVTVWERGRAREFSLRSPSVGLSDLSDG